MNSLSNKNSNGKHQQRINENEIIFEGWLSKRDITNNTWTKQWIVIHQFNLQILLSAFKYSHVYLNPLYSHKLSNNFEISLICSNNKYNKILINNINTEFSTPSHGIYQQWIKQFTNIKNTINNIWNDHKLFFIKHSITQYLLPYEQYRIASINKSIHKYICNKSIYNHMHFIRDALYWNKYYKTHQINFNKIFKSMDIKELMQAKYNIIYLHKINEYIHNNNNKNKNIFSELNNMNNNELHFIYSISDCINMKYLDFSSFIKPKMLMMEQYSYSSSDESDDECVSISYEIQQFEQFNRLKYIYDILKYTNFNNKYNPIQNINLSDNSLNNNDFINILNSIQNNKCIQFTNILTLDISQNMFIGQSLSNNIYTLLFNTISTTFPNLSILNLSETGITNQIFDEIIKFNTQNPNHSLTQINMKHCDELYITNVQLNNINNINNIQIIYDNKSIMDTNINTQSDNEFEFGFDCNFDDDVSDNDNNNEYKDDIYNPNEVPSLLNHIKNTSKTQSDNDNHNIKYKPINYIITQDFDDTDSDGFVYMDIV